MFHLWANAVTGAQLAPDQSRRLAAKRNNERVKLIVTSLNTVGLAILGTAFIVPGINNIAAFLSPGPWILLIVAIGLPLSAHGFVRFLRSEE